jgi:hypothetical protein
MCWIMVRFAMGLSAPPAEPGKRRGNERSCGFAEEEADELKQPAQA